MQKRIGAGTLELTVGDITVSQADAIVNAANSRLAGGGGVDGAIHRAGGPAIMQETARRYPDGCPTGSAVISGAGDLPARFVLHAVGPVWSGGRRGEDEQLAAAYRRCFELAAQEQCESVALPALSAGAYRFPIDQAAEIALREAIEHLRGGRPPNLVRFVLFTEGVYSAFAAALENMETDK